jgi:molybdopterin converting factor small subunit
MANKTRIKLRLIGVLKKLYGKDKFEMEFDGETEIRNVIQMLANTSTQEFKRALIDPELQDPRPNTLILVNGKEIGVLNGLETKIRDNDQIILISVSHGG